VERGLDNLADLEGAVTGAVSGTAQNLYSTTVSSVKIPTWKKSATPQDNDDQKEMEQSRSRPPPVSGFGKKGNNALDTQATVESFVMRKRVAQPTETAGNDHDDMSESEDEADGKATKPSVPSNPYELLLQRSYPKKVETGRAAPAAVAYRKPDLNALMAGKNNRMIRANGGASTPYNNEQRQPPPSVARATQPSPQSAKGPDPMRRETQASSPRPSPPVAKNAFPGNTPRRPPPRPVRPYDDDEDQSLMGKLAQALPSIPRMSFPKMRFRGRNSFRNLSAAATLDAWNAEDEAAESRGFLALFRRKDREPKNQSASPSRSKPKGRELTPPLADLMERCHNGKSVSVLSAADESKCVGIGRSRALLDIAFLSFVLIGVRQLPNLGTIILPWSVSELISSTVPSVLSTLANAMDTWAPYAFAAAILATRTNSLLFNMGVEPLIRTVESAIRDETQYGVLFLRLMSAMPSGNRVPERMQFAARSQILSKVGATRMTSFVTFFLASIFLMTVSFVQPLLVALIRAPAQICDLEQWHSWPLRWRELAVGLKGIFVQLYRAICTMIGTEITSMVDNPLMVAYGASIVAALLAASFLPMLESKRKVQPIADDENDVETAALSADFTQHVSNLGVSGATRLGLLSDGSAVERVLERWRMLLPQFPDTVLAISAPSLIRLVCYGIVSGAILVAPLLVHSYIGISSFGSSASSLIGFDVAIILLFTHRLVWEAVATAVQTIDANRGVVGFLSSLAGAVQERTQMLESPQANLQLQASISNAAGLVAKDIWAAHTTKRAWAIRGANLACTSGEILVILGDDGSGKSRLLTTLAESMLFPPRSTLSTNRVRGSISLGGLDVGKWDKTQLKKRVGLMLNDVRTAADSAQVLSGLTLEEILEPSDGLRTLDPSRNPGATERASMMVALKITGLYSSLLPRLPTKLSTVLTANEEDLKPSPLKPRYNVVSPAEWSKLLLTKVLTQAIYDNENSAGSIDDVKNCLVGSILLLDDVVAHLSEVDEARTIRDLRETGAATIVATNRWATGRFADRIAVVKDGTVVESGTHSELMNRGPQQSIYAAKWHAMTTQ
jgi:ABC-type multidrug transport system fused ATPase/permease subunit